MHIEIDEKTFALHLGRVRYAIASKAPQLIYTALIIEATNNQVVFKACDLSMEIVSVCDETVKVILPGTISIVEKDIPKLYGLNSIQVPKGSNQAWFYCATGKTRVGLLNGEEYPQINFTAEDTAVFSSSLLAEGFEMVSFAAPQDEYKQTWASVFLQSQGDVIQFMAGESQRMTLFSINSQENSQISSCMIASSAIKAVTSFLKTEEGEVKLAVRKDRGLLKIEDSKGGYIICRTLAGDYPGAILPGYIQGISTKEGALRREVIFSVSDLLKILEILEPSATAASNRLKVQINADDQTMKLWAVTDGKESFQEIPAIIKGESLEVCINFLYLLSNLRNLKEKEGVMELFGDRLPFFLRPNSDKELVIVTAVMASVPS